MISKCPKCGGNMAKGKEGDFYSQVHLLKCLNCGKTIYFRFSKFHSE